jgi:hypothetical protein
MDRQETIAAIEQELDDMLADSPEYLSESARKGVKEGTQPTQDELSIRCHKMNSRARAHSRDSCRGRWPRLGCRCGCGGKLMMPTTTTRIATRTTNASGGKVIGHR